MVRQLQSPLRALFVLAVVGLLIYSNSFNCEFCSDDYSYIVENPAIKDIGNIANIWSSFNTRFLVGVSFAVNYWFGGLKTFPYHLVNVLIHLAASYLVYWFVLMIFETPRMSRHKLKENSFQIAFFTSLIFLVHPIQTQGVTYISQRAVSLATLFYLGALCLYGQGRLKSNWRYYPAAYLAMVLGMFTKEMTMTIPIALILLEIFFFVPSTQRRWLQPCILLCFVLAIGLIPWALTFDQPGSVLQLKHQVGMHSFNWDYFFTEINVLRSYIRLVFLPVNQSHHYDYPISHGFWEWPTVLSAIFLALLGAAAVMAYKKDRLISFSIIWFFLSTSVEALHVCFVNLGVIYDHWLYLAMVGLSLLLTAGLFTLIKNTRFCRIILTGIIFILGILTYQRNQVWQSCTKVWEEIVHHSPTKAFAYNNLGLEYSRRGNIDLAIQNFHKAVQVEPQAEPFIKSVIYQNLGYLYGNLGDSEKEIKYAFMSLHYNPNNAYAYSNLGLAFTDKGMYDLGIEYCQKAVALNPQATNSYNNLGVVYARKGEFEQAVEYFQQAVHLDPDNSIAQQNLADALSKRNP